MPAIPSEFTFLLFDVTKDTFIMVVFSILIFF